ncbi:hypothetical protein JYU20_03460, partial [Bacteroidales bacterium AH-315-I05]|nr:hypothetical protein [Bacteroidales bacterium AH-315-I05]
MKNLFPFLLLFLTTIVNAAEPQTLIIKENDAVDYYSLGQKSILLEDENHELSFEDVNKGLIEEKGIQLTEEISNLDLTTSAYWVKFSIKNESSETKRFHLEVARPVTNKADLYIVRKNDEMKIIKHGDGLPFDNREIRHRKIIFPIVLKPNEENTCYLNLASDGEVITLPIKLWNTDALEERDYAEQFTFGIYFGILLFVIIIYFFFFIALRDKSFKYYVLYVASLLLMQFSIDGLAFQYFWPFSPWIGNHAVLIFSCLTILFVLKYAQAFMKIKDNLPVYNKIFNVFILLSAICVALSFTSGTLYSFVFPAANVLGFLSTIFILATIFACSRKQIHISGF